MTFTSAFALMVLVVTFAINGSVMGQSDTAAVVNEQRISLNVVHHFLDRAFANHPELADRKNRSAESVQIGVEYCVSREVILQFLGGEKYRTSEEEVDRRIEEFDTQLKRAGKTLEQHLKEIELTLPEFRREQKWKSSWRKYATKFVTVDHLRKQFELKRKYFDGTKMHVAQILLKGDDAKTIKKAEGILEQLNAKEISWSDAVEKYSESASVANGGDIGWINYSGPMPREFTQRAFELSSGEYANPFSSTFGVHLVHCIEIVEGTKTFEDVAPQLREIETNRLFQLVAKRNRSDAKVEIFTLDFESRK